MKLGPATLYRDGIRIGNTTLFWRLGRAGDRGFGLGAVYRRHPFGRLVLTLGPWAAEPGPLQVPAGWLGSPK